MNGRTVEYSAYIAVVFLVIELAAARDGGGNGGGRAVRVAVGVVLAKR